MTIQGLPPDVPGASRTKTAPYGVPRWPMRRQLPDPSDLGSIACFAANCLASRELRSDVRESDAHLVAILEQTIELQERLAAALEVSAGLKDELDSARLHALKLDSELRTVRKAMSDVVHKYNMAMMSVRNDETEVVDVEIP